MINLKKKKINKLFVIKIVIPIAFVLFFFALFYGISTIVGYLKPNPFYTY